MPRRVSRLKIATYNITILTNRLHNQKHQKHQKSHDRHDSAHFIESNTIFYFRATAQLNVLNEFYLIYIQI